MANKFWKICVNNVLVTPPELEKDAEVLVYLYLESSEISSWLGNFGKFFWNNPVVLLGLKRCSKVIIHEFMPLFVSGYTEASNQLSEVRRENAALSDEIKDIMEQISEGGRRF